MSDQEVKSAKLKKSKMLEKWGRDVSLRGFVQVPYYLININKFMSEEKKLSSLELLILIQLTSNWWEKNSNPYPSMVNLAERCNVSDRQIQRSINNIEKKGYIKREKISSSSGVMQRNSYDMSILVSILNEIASAHPRIF